MEFRRRQFLVAAVEPRPIRKILQLANQLTHEEVGRRRGQRNYGGGIEAPESITQQQSFRQDGRGMARIDGLQIELPVQVKQLGLIPCQIRWRSRVCSASGFSGSMVKTRRRVSSAPGRSPCAVSRRWSRCSTRTHGPRSASSGRAASSSVTRSSRDSAISAVASVPSTNGPVGAVDSSNKARSRNSDARRQSPPATHFSPNRISQVERHEEGCSSPSRRSMARPSRASSWQRPAAWRSSQAAVTPNVGCSSSRA